jgi:hypothetical protein
MAMTDPVPELATRLTLADEVPVRSASPSPGPGDAGCCPGSQTPPPVPAEGPVPGSGSLVPAGEPELPELGLGSRKLTAWEWLVQVLGHWTGLYAATVKKRRENPPPESLREHVRWAMAGGWNAWLPESCVRTRKALGFVEGPYQFLISIPVHAGCESVRKASRYSILGLPILGLVIYFLVRAL